MIVLLQLAELHEPGGLLNIEQTLRNRCRGMDTGGVAQLD